MTGAGDGADWYLEELGLHEFVALCTEFDAHLRAQAAGVVDAERAFADFRDLLTRVFASAAGPLWISLDLAARPPVVTTYDFGSGVPVAGGDARRGLAIVAGDRGDLAARFARSPSGSALTLSLPPDAAPS